MKKVLFVLVLMLSAGIIANAQFKFGVKAGMNASGVNIENLDTKTRVGLSAGILGQFKINERWAIQPEALYNMQGYKAKISGVDCTFKTDYVSIPVMVQFYAVEGFSIEVGPQFGILVSAKIKGESDGQSASVDFKDQMKSFEAAVVVGAAYELSAIPVGFFARCSLGLTETTEASFGTDIKNHGFQLGAFVKF